ncbi:MAG: GNAT family N-acetyltransferase [Chloroflexota bacterium]
MVEIKVRPLRLDDHVGVSAVDEATQKQYLGNAWDILSDLEKDAHLTSRGSEFAMNIATGYGYVAVNVAEFADEHILGFVLAYEALPFRDHVYIRYIAIHPEYQARGIGGLLYKAVIEKAEQNGISKIATLINLDNPESMKLHEKVGFKLITRKEAILPLGEDYRS